IIDQFWEINGDTIVGPDLEGIILDGITTDTIFNLILTVQNLCGPDTQLTEILVHPYPLASFGVNADEGCTPFEVDFANNTLGEAETYIWTMGNGNTYSDSIPPNQVYTTTDTSITSYTISLVAINACGIDTATQEVSALPPDVRAFIQLDTLSGCSPLVLQLENFSTPGAQNSWLIEAPDGTQEGSALPNPIVTLETPGVHTILLFASGCGEDIDTAYVEVLPAPEPAFEFQPQGCIGEAISFENLTEGIGGSSWSFGDGSMQEVQNPTHAYDAAGVYEVTLTTYSLINNCPATVNGTIEILGNPTAAFEPSGTSGCAPLTVDFLNTSSGVGDLDFVWDFDDGSSASFEAEPTHTFTNSGTFSVRLRATDERNCSSDSVFLSIEVFPDPVSAFSFEAENYCLGYDTLQLINNSVDAVSYEWTLPDGIYTTENLAWMPNEPGVFPIQLIVQNGTQCADTTQQEVTYLVSPEASFEFGPTEGCEGLEVSFTNGSLNAEGYTWDFKNGNSSTAFNPTQVFNAPGNFEVELIAFNFNDCPADTLVQVVTVRPRPIADFSFDPPTNCGAPKEVVFENLSEGNVNNIWLFGDGGTSELTMPANTFEDPGQYEVTLLVDNQFGCSDTLVQVIDILGRPEAALQLSVNQGCAPLYVETTNLSQQAQTYIWSIESLPLLESRDPAFVLESPGQYDLELVAVYNDRCVDTLRIPDAISVYETPSAAFDYNVDPLESLLGDVLFYNFSQRSDRYLWDLGDGQTTIAFEPIHQYDFNGPIEVELFAVNDNGGAWTCVDSTTEVLVPEWITTFHAPNALSPEYGEEGVRIFKPVGIGLEEYAISIYSPTENRSGIPINWKISNLLKDGMVPTGAKFCPRGYTPGWQK
ncbi:MAG: PKD domain-containing protein, partial [Mameliella sp.]|nr:PKD domain-containing protein [Phaeodactylibacter sp.]